MAAPAAGAFAFASPRGRDLLADAARREFAQCRVQSAGDLTVHNEELPILEVVLRTENIKQHVNDPELTEYMVRVQWEWTVPSGQSFWLRRFFSPRMTVTELRDPETSRKICVHVGV